MTKKATGTNGLQDAWAGWLNFVREVTGAKSGGLKTPDLKTRPKRPNKVPLKRDVKVLRRPQPKRRKSVIREMEGLKREPVEDVPKLADFITRIRPLADAVVSDELGRVLEKSINKILVDRLANVLAHIEKNI